MNKQDSKKGTKKGMRPGIARIFAVPMVVLDVLLAIVLGLVALIGNLILLIVKVVLLGGMILHAVARRAGGYCLKRFKYHFGKLTHPACEICGKHESAEDPNEAVEFSPSDGRWVHVSCYAMQMMEKIMGGSEMKIIREIFSNLG